MVASKHYGYPSHAQHTIKSKYYISHHTCTRRRLPLDILIIYKIREGMTVVSPLPEGCLLEREIILAIFSSIGRCRFLDEKHFDACTALCGSGPAFVCVALEALADGGVMMGLPRAEALELAAQSK